MTHPVQLQFTPDPFSEALVPEQVDTEIRDITYERLGIDEARALQVIAYTTPANAKTQCIVVRTAFVTIEAQNALLKLFEEPPGTTTFVVYVPGGLQLLPTLLSRVQVVSVSEDAQTNTATWHEFVAASPADRLKLIEKKLKEKDSAWLSAIQQGVQGWARAQSTVTPSVQLVIERLGTRGASNKMLLELLALELG